MIRGGPIFFTLVLAVLTNRAVAQSDAELPEAYLAIKAVLGFEGSASVHNDRYTLTQNDDAAPIVIPEVDSAADLNTSFGAEAQYVFSLHRYFGVGGVFGMRAWKSAAGESTSFNFDVGLSPQFRIPVSTQFELYVAVPIAVVLSVLGEYKAWSEARHSAYGTAKSVSPTYGYGLGLLAGARFAISGSFGGLLEVGYQRYAFTHGVQFQILESLDMMGLGTRLELDVVTEQLRVNAGVFF